MKNKATHAGTCQVCGRLQKLPDGNLSLHGYTTRCGFFEGVCHGAGALPFEQDKSLIEAAIARAELRAAEIREIQAGLRATVGPEVSKAWASVYFPYRSKFQRAGYEWHEVTVTSETVAYSDGGSYLRFTREKVPGEFDGGAHNRSWTHSDKTLAEVITGMNSRKAASMDKTLTDIAQYVKWQTVRIKDWAPAPLKSLK